MMPLKTILLSIVAVATTAISAVAAPPSILDLKHSITDENVVPPESFETKTSDLEKSFFFKKYAVRPKDTDVPHTGTAKEYEDILSHMKFDMEMPYNSVVGNYINMYLGRKRPLVSDMLALHSYYKDIFIEELTKQDVPLELQYLPVIESAINPNAVSRAGAVGLWQFMPGTAAGIGMEINSLVDERRDPRKASEGAARYLKQLYNIYGDWSLAIAAYNCGPGNVNKALKRAGGGKQDFWQIYNYLPAETRGYVPAFIAANYVMNNYQRYGIEPTVLKHAITTDTVNVDKRVHFRQISEVLNIPIEEIRMLNPQYRRDVIPGDNRPYPLTLPSQQCLSYIQLEDKIIDYDHDLYAQRTYVEPGTTRLDDGQANLLTASEQTQNADSNAVITNDIAENIIEQKHTVGRGENLRDIAKKYGVSATDLKRWNNLRRGKVKEGDVLTVKIYQRQLAEASTTPTAESTVTTTVTQQPKKAENSKSSTSSKSSSTAKKKKESKPKTTTYTAKSGDSYERIAKKHGITVKQLQEANGVKSGSTKLDIGQKLIIPSKSSSKNSKAGKSSKKSKKKSKKRRRR